jgi:hypothetical protein
LLDRDSLLLSSVCLPSFFFLFLLQEKVNHDKEKKKTEKNSVVLLFLVRCEYTVAAKIIRTISFLIKDSQNTDVSRFGGYQKNRHVV